MKKILISSLILLGLSSVLAGELKIHAINVGWGQSVLVEGVNGKTLLLDAGLANKRQIVSDYLQQQNIQQLDYFVLSHNHSDHGGGAEYVVREFKPKSSFYSGAVENTERVFMKNWFSAYQEAGVSGPVGLPLGHVFDLGDGASATAIAVNGNVFNQNAVIGKLKEINPDYQFPVSKHINDSSIVLLIKYKGFDYLVSGDLGGHDHNGQEDFETPVIMSALLSGNANINTPTGGIDILHVGHHGSKTSTNSQYLDLAQPEIAIVSVGPNQSHGLPNREAIDELLIAKGIKVLQTDEGRLSDSRTSTSGFVVGHIQISTNGESYLITNDESSIDRSKDSQLNVTGESFLAGLPLTQLVDNNSLPPVNIDELPELSVDLMSDPLMNLRINASDDKGLEKVEVFIDQIQVGDYTLNSELSSQLTHVIDRYMYTQSSHEILVTVTDLSQQMVTKVLSFGGLQGTLITNELIERESNNTASSANPVSEPIVKIMGYFLTTSDNDDWYELELKAGQSLTLLMTGPSDNQQDYDLYLYSEGGTLLEYSEAWGTTEQLDFRNNNVSKTKTLRINVSRYDGFSSQTPYQLVLSRL